MKIELYTAYDVCVLSVVNFTTKFFLNAEAKIDASVEHT